MALAIDGRKSLSDQVRDIRDEAVSMRGEANVIAREMQTLARMEMDLARAEMQEARAHATKGSVFAAMAAEYGIIMSVFLFLAIMFGLDTVMPMWAAALITTGIAAVVAALFGLLAMQQWKRFSPLPRRAIRSMQEDIRWARSQIRSNAR